MMKISLQENILRVRELMGLISEDEIKGLLKGDINQMLNQIKLYEVLPNIFVVFIKDQHLRAMVFMRYQEFYEAYSDTFRGKGFKWDEYVDWYKKHTMKDYFSYGSDWLGYNIPCHSIESCIKQIPDLNPYDLIMISIVDEIHKMIGDQKYYLIGVDDVSGNIRLLNHEIAHALYFTNKDYREGVLGLIKDMDQNVKQEVINTLNEYGYTDEVYNDEIQAYLSTGLGSKMKDIPNVENEVERFENLFNQFFTGVDLKKIDITWKLELFN